MHVGMGLIQNEHGVWIVRVRVPKRLQEAVACVLDNGKDHQTFLQRSLGTKDKKEAIRLAPEVLVSFRKVLDKAEDSTGVAIRIRWPCETVTRQRNPNRLGDHFVHWLIGRLGLDVQLNVAAVYTGRSAGSDPSSSGRRFSIEPFQRQIACLTNEQQRRHGHHAVDRIHDRHEVPICSNVRANQSG
jgi:hypothetical protein